MNNFISRGEVLTFPAASARVSGQPCREHGFNGVALINAEPGEAYTLQVRGVFEFPLANVKRGDRIYINDANKLSLVQELNTVALYGRAVTPTDENGDFHCYIIQSN